MQEATFETRSKLGSTPPPAPSVPLRVVMNGNRLDIQASVDLEGLKKLQAMLEKYQGILEMMQPDPDAELLKLTAKKEDAN
jgi:hypothetical protein